jgi:hypothetical protein
MIVLYLCDARVRAEVKCSAVLLSRNGVLDCVQRLLAPLVDARLQTDSVLHLLQASIRTGPAVILFILRTLCAWAL